MDIGILHTHIFFSAFFLLLFIIKTCLLCLNNKKALHIVRKKTKIVDIIAGFLIIFSGIYLAFVQNTWPIYILIKITTIIFAIPLGIIAMHKQHKIMAIISLVLFLYIYGIAVTKYPVLHKINNIHSISIENKILKNNIDTQYIYGKTLYNNLCTSCHGIDGNKQLYKAPNPFKNDLSPAQKEAIIKNGKGIMQSYATQLSAYDISCILIYLKNKK